MPRTRASKKIVNPHEIQAQIASLNTRFDPRTSGAIRVDPRTGVSTVDARKLDGLLRARERERKALSAKSRSTYQAPLGLFSSRCCCCCCCCCRDEVPGEGDLWIRDLDYDKFVVFGEIGLTDYMSYEPQKKASGSAGTAGLCDDSMSRISFGFKTQFDLPFDDNRIKVRSGVHLILGWIEAQSFHFDAWSQVLVNHYVNVSTGAYHTDKMATVFYMFAPAGQYGQGGSQGERDSEIEIELERTGQGSTIVVDEAVIVEAVRFGDLNHSTAVGQVTTHYEPLHVVVRDLE